jgi:hypothetical protein
MGRRDFAHIEADELRKLELDLRGAPHRVQWNATQLLETRVGPMIADAMRADARGHRYLPKLPDAVSHEMIDKDTVEVGLEPAGRRHQGSLAHIIVYGSVNNQPVYDHMAGPRRRLPRIERMFADMAEDAVLGDEE